MARVTVEDCVDKVSNRFDLVLLSAHRAREISGGSELTIDRDRDKNPVVALREIAEQTVRPHDIQDALVDRKSVVSGKRVSVRVDCGGRSSIKKQNATYQQNADETKINTHIYTT